MFEWDEAKRKHNLLKHGLDFEMVYDLEWSKALRTISSHNDYVEERWAAILPYNDRLHVCVYTMRGRVTRIISLRKANKREQLLYENAMDD